MIYVFSNGSVVYDGNILSKEEKDRAVAIEKLPIADNVDGKIAVLHADKLQNKIWYEYVDIPVKLKIPTTEDYLIDLDYRLSVIELGV